MRKKKLDLLDYQEPVTKIYFVRHGETLANKKRLIFGHLDWDLTNKGIKDSYKTSKVLYKEIKKVDFIISSPLKRTMHTAEIIAKQFKTKKILTENNLIEKGEGIWEGKNYWEVRENDYKNYLKWLKDPLGYRPYKGESIKDMNKRIIKFQKSILNNYSGKTLIVVSHAGPIRLFLLNLLKSDLNNFWSIQIKCGSITEINISKKQFTLVRINYLK